MKLLLKLRLNSIILILTALAALPAAGIESVELEGLIEPYLIINVGSAVPGVLESVKVDRGDMVKKDQALAILQSDVEKATRDLARTRAQLQSTIKAREARLKFSKRKQERMEELYKKKAIPFEEMDEYRTNTVLALMELEEAKDNKRLAWMEYKRSAEVVKRMTIRSPIAGVVMERFLAPGEYIEDQPILKLAQIDPLNVEVFVPLELLGSIKVGMSAEVRPENPLNAVYQAKVKIVDPVVDAASGTFGVRLELPNPKYSLPAGLKCKVTFPNK